MDDLLTFLKETIFPIVTVGGLLYIGAKIQLLSHLDKTIGKIKNNVNVIANTLIKSSIPFDEERLQTYSPLKISEKGTKFLEDIGFIELFSENYQDFFDCIDDDDPKTEYDTESSAARSVFFLFDKPYFNSIKDYLYKNPKEDVKEVIKIAGIYVRDRYVERKQPKTEKQES